MDKPNTLVMVYTTLFPSYLAPVHGIFTQELSYALSKKLNVTIINPINGFKFFSFFKKKNISQSKIFSQTHHPLFWVTPKFFKKYDAFLLYFWTRKRILSCIKLQGKPNILHAHYAYPDAAAAHLIAKEFNIPLVTTVHGSDIYYLAKEGARRKLITKTLQGSSKIVCVSKQLLSATRTLTDITDNRISHIPNGVDLLKFFPTSRTQARTELKLPLDIKIVLTVGRLHPIKGYDRLIEALSYLDSKTHLFLVGNGPLQTALTNQAHRNHLSHRVHFVGAVQHDCLRNWYCAADVLAIASYSEGWPTIIYEAYACGLPVVAHKVGGISEIIKSTALGLMVSNNNPNTLAELLARALIKKWNSEIILNEARENSWEKIADKYIDIYHSLNESN